MQTLKEAIGNSLVAKLASRGLGKRDAGKFSKSFAAPVPHGSCPHKEVRWIQLAGTGKGKGNPPEFMPSKIPLAHTDCIPDAIKNQLMATSFRLPYRRPFAGAKAVEASLFTHKAIRVDEADRPCSKMVQPRSGEPRKCRFRAVQGDTRCRKHGGVQGRSKTQRVPLTEAERKAFARG